MARKSDENRWAIYAGEPMRQAIGEDAENRSARLNAICARYLDILAHDAPAFTREEWAVLTRARGITELQGSSRADSLLLVVANTEQERQRGEKWRPETAPVGSLTARARDLPRGAFWALVEIVDRYWEIETDYPRAVALRRAGARIAESPAVATP